MQQALRDEAVYFDDKKHNLRAIFDETLTQCAENKHVAKDKLIEMCLKTDDERYIRSIIENPISIVLLGNRPCVKARIVNYLLDYELLPVFDYYDSDYERSRRAVRIIYGPQRRHAFCIRHFELIECVPSHTEHVISFDDLRLDPVIPNGSGASPSQQQSSTSTSTDYGALHFASSSSAAATSTSGVGPTAPIGQSGRNGRSFSLTGERVSLTTTATTTSGFGSNGEQSNRVNNTFTSSASSFSRNVTGGVGAGPAIASSSYSDGFESRNNQNSHNHNHAHRSLNNLDRKLNYYDGEDKDCAEIGAVNEMTTLEIVLPHQLLEKNLQIRVAPDVENFDIIYRSTFYRTNPIIMYCFERHDDRLTETDVSHLDALRQLMPSSPILFTHINDFDPTFSTWGLSPSLFTPASGYHAFDDDEVGVEVAEFTMLEKIDKNAARPNAIPLVSAKNENLNMTTDDNKNDAQTKSAMMESDNSDRHRRDSSYKHYLDTNCACESLWQQLADIGFFVETGNSEALKAPHDRGQRRLSNGYYIINDAPFKSAKQIADYGIDIRSRFLCLSQEFCCFLDFFRAILKSNLVIAATLLNEIHNQFIQYFIFTAFDMTWSLNHSIPRRLEYAKAKEAELYTSLMGIANRKQNEIRQLIGEMVGFMRNDIIEQASNYAFSKPTLNLPAAHEVLSASIRKDCVEEIQEFVFAMLNRAIAVKLMSSVDVMRETFIGTLQRCLETLELLRPVPEKETEKPCSEDKIDFALSQLLDSAYSIEISINTSNSILRIFWQRMKQFFVNLPLAAYRPNCTLDAEWKRRVASELIDNLSEAKLSKYICTQFREKLKIAHANFVSSLANLETALVGEMKDIDNRRNKIRKKDAPMFARLALESTSFIDGILYGVPKLSKEIGRGQFGVVFSSKKSWAGYSRIAVKSILMCNDQQWNDLPMEFYYTRSLPESERIVQIRGSIIERHHNRSLSYVYLIMERLTRDLYCGIKTGIDWIARLQIGLDVVHGLRFLHNHGLIHRDIKLKNVLLDKNNRAKITDLGFCKSEVMISGSVVGTPIHMAPEVFTGKYDSTVDVYAFGILFWYICAGSVDLPAIFQQFINKDHLWISVKRGLRPERLQNFDDQCFSLMEHCWAGEPTRRPILGEVETILMQIKERFEESSDTPPDSALTSSAPN